MLVIRRRSGEGIIINDDLQISVENAGKLYIHGNPEKYKVRRAEWPKEHPLNQRKSDALRLIFDEVSQEWIYCEVLWTASTKQEAEIYLDAADAMREGGV